MRRDFEQPGISPALKRLVLKLAVLDVAAVTIFVHWYPQICAAWNWMVRR